MNETSRRVLVIGRLPAVNQRVVAQIEALGHAATGAVGEGSFPELDGRGFDLVAIGSGVDAETRAALKQRVAAQGVRVLDVYGPVAAEQVDAALRHPDRPPLITGLTVTDAGEVRRVEVRVRAACSLRLDVYRHRGAPEPEIVGILAAQVAAGNHMVAVAEALTGEGHNLVVRADGDEIAVRVLPAVE